MKTVAYVALHYGVEFLPWAIRSVQDHVSEVWVFYTATPSFGHQTSVMCPESEEMLRDAAHRFAKIPIRWNRGSWRNEGEHRACVKEVLAKTSADVVLWLDADEIWDPDTLKRWLTQAASRNENIFRVPFVHFFRSLDQMVTDPAMPSRIIRGAGSREEFISASPEDIPVMHFGYAQSSRIVEYKWKIHGHLNELKPGWLQNVWARWRPGDEGAVHPTNEGWWHPKPAPDYIRQAVQRQLHDHPYYGKPFIA